PSRCAATAPALFSTLSLHDALPIFATSEGRRAIDAATKLYLAGEPLDMSVLARALGIGRATLYRHVGNRDELIATVLAEATERTDRKSTRLNSSHVKISYAVFCLKK